MDARSKADFINSIAGGKVLCPACNMLNDDDSLFCSNCGYKLDIVINNGQNNQNTSAPAEEQSKSAPAFAPAGEQSKSAPVFAPAGEQSKSAPAFAPAGEQSKSTPAFAPAREQPKTTTASAPAFVQAQTAATTEVVDEVSVFAQGLPDWDIVPPDIMVRRKRKK